ncbi:MAG: hypothetical protein JWR19_552 [Pedosphaera sp.]|nr:hypothetical protein [Pedosphaera sp.]
MAGSAFGQRGLQTAEGITNFHRVNELLYRGAQPDEAGLEVLKRLGVKTIVDLQMPKEIWPAEAAKAQTAGITYTNVPLRGLSRPTKEQIATVLAIIKSGPAPVYIHCEHGCDRTGTVIACYRIQQEQWPMTKALAEAKQYGMSRWEIGMKRFVKAFGQVQEKR